VSSSTPLLNLPLLDSADDAQQTTTIPDASADLNDVLVPADDNASDTAVPIDDHANDASVPTDGDVASDTTGTGNTESGSSDVLWLDDLCVCDEVCDGSCDCDAEDYRVWICVGNDDETCVWQPAP
jgi:hypothetical protein